MTLEAATAPTSGALPAPVSTPLVWQILITNTGTAAVQFKIGGSNAFEVPGATATTPGVANLAFPPVPCGAVGSLDPTTISINAGGGTIQLTYILNQPYPTLG